MNVMTPFYDDVSKSNKTIYINPNFKGQLPTHKSSVSEQLTSMIPTNAHINPLFLEMQRCGNTIHMNPAFLPMFRQQKVVNKNTLTNESRNCLINQASDAETNSFNESVPTETRKIICKTKNRLIREPLKLNDDQRVKLGQTTFSLQPLLLLNKRKLVRKASILPEKPNSIKKCVGDSNTRITRYKLDNRVNRRKPLLPPTPKIRRTSYVGRYALKRTTVGETSIVKNSVLINKNKNKKLQVLNINGLLYKSTQNSLKLKGITSERILNSSKPDTLREKLSSNTNQGLVIFVRGSKYVMDANKFKLTRVTNPDNNSPNRIANTNSSKAPTCKRIDIGGYTYVSTNSAKNVLIRTTNHLSRAYVNNAKQKSLSMLTKRLVKTNIPCPIFQRIGKCAAFERGKCSKVHNKLQVAICSRFLRGECPNTNCLMSHNVSLSKMPVCKFFLQGVCVRNDCPYLHKKLSNNAEFCADFLRGFCEMAEKCNKRHEFVCPEFERNNICTTKNCVYCNAKRRKESQLTTKPQKLRNKNCTKSNLSAAKFGTATENQSNKRYFKDSSNKTTETTNESNAQFINEDTANNIDDTEYFEEDVENIRKPRPNLGSLPAYIPL